jgi:hypothetical protein
MMSSNRGLAERCGTSASVRPLASGCVELAGEQIPPGDRDLLLLGVAGQLDDLERSCSGRGMPCSELAVQMNMTFDRS